MTIVAPFGAPKNFYYGLGVAPYINLGGNQNKAGLTKAQVLSSLSASVTGYQNGTALSTAKSKASAYGLKIEANRFLHHMVRFLVGTMIDAALARRPADDMDALLRAEDNSEVSPPAPPHALFLDRVTYPADLYLSEP